MKELILDEEFGQYADSDGSLHACFITNNDITGGNSGSPVINGQGELIGIAFDGNWEAMSGDLAFEPELQRCISVDIRFVLWVIDKYAGATHLIDEMKNCKIKKLQLRYICPVSNWRGFLLIRLICTGIVF